MPENVNPDRVVSGEQQGNSDADLDLTLRPKSFDDFIGQKQIKHNLHVYITAAKKRGESLDHILFSGPPGLGKTTLANIVANEMESELKSTSGPVLEKARDLAGVLSNLQPGDVLFIDEIHRMIFVVEEYLYSAMEDFSIDLLIDQGPSARSIKINLPSFTLVGATTREGLLTSPLRSRFGVLERLEYYEKKNLTAIVLRAADLLGIEIDEDAAAEIGSRSRGTPRVANRFVRRVRDVAQVEGSGRIDLAAAQKGLEMLGVDRQGLEKIDRRILRMLVEQKGNPVGLKTIAVSIGEEEGTIEDVYEPFLIQEGLLLKTARGRIPADRTYQLFGVRPGDQETFDFDAR